MRSLLIVSYIMYFVLLYFSPLVKSAAYSPLGNGACDDYSWVPEKLLTLSSQCIISAGCDGKCKKSSIGKLMRLADDVNCRKVSCARRTRTQKIVAVPMGPPLVGTLCGKNKVCDPKQKCVKIPKERLPKAVGSDVEFPCVKQS